MIELYEEWSFFLTFLEKGDSKWIDIVELCKFSFEIKIKNIKLH